MGFSDENFCSNAPWKDRGRKVMVRVTQTLVCDFEIEVPESAEEDEIKELAKQARVTPFGAVNAMGEDDWDLFDEKIEII